MECAPLEVHSGNADTLIAMISRAQIANTTINDLHILALCNVCTRIILMIVHMASTFMRIMLLSDTIDVILFEMYVFGV